MVGKTVGKYRIVGQLGRGGMGTVYKAVDTTLDRDVAIKVLNAEIADTETMDRFRAEATILAKLNHPEIATIHEIFQFDSDLLMVVEFVRGETLEKLSDCLGPMPAGHAACLIDKILLALEHTHRAGVVHRDIKPPNVMITERGDVKIMDFGVARVRGAERITLEGALMGTPAYMPPEQVLGYEVDARADLYSVGVVFYRLLTGVLPFAADSAVDMLQKQISEAPTPLQMHRADLPDWCERIMQRAFAKSPDDRFQSAGEFRDALGKAAGAVSTPELTKAFASSVVKLGQVSSRQSAVVERFGVTPFPGTTAQPSVLPTSRSISLDPTPLGVSTRTPPGRRSVFVGHSARMVSVTIVAVTVSTLVMVALWGPASINPEAIPATQSTAASATVPSSDAARSARKGATKSFAVPFAFNARIVLNNGDRQSERACQVVLADGTITIQSSDDDALSYELPYDAILSINYSRARHPLWNTRSGPRPVLRSGGGVFGLFRGARHWVSLRTTNSNRRFVVLRFANETQAKRALAALAERTGRTAQIVVERKEDE